MNKRYLGDAVYAEQDGLDLILTTENGIKVTNRIVLEPQILNELCIYLQLVRKAGHEPETKTGGSDE